MPREIATLDLKLMNDEYSVGEADMSFKNHIQKFSENKNLKRQGLRVLRTVSIMHTTLTSLRGFMLIESEWFPPKLLLSSSLSVYLEQDRRREGRKGSKPSKISFSQNVRIATRS